MATNVDLYRSGSYESVEYQEFSIKTGISSRVISPTASFQTHVEEAISAGQDARIQIDGTTVFEGSTISAGTKRSRGQVDVKLEHPAAELFDGSATFSLATPTDEEVLDAALTNANTNESYQLTFSPTASTLNNDYSADSRSVKSIFRDMMDRSGLVWWVDPATTDIYVEAAGGRGLWQSLSASADGIAVRDFDDGSIKTVRNDVTVTGTGDEAVTGTAEDSTSISNYGRRKAEYNVNYAITTLEADALASSLIQADPLPEGTVLVDEDVGSITEPQVNKTVDITDDTKNISASGLLIEQQTIEQGRATLSVGSGTGDTIAEGNRQQKSSGDVTEPGSVYNSDRIAANAIDQGELVDGSVVEAKLADLAVSLQKVQDGAIDTVKIGDDAIEAPKILAGEVTAAKLNTDLARANRLYAGEIEALDIKAGTLTANEIDTLDLDTTEITIGSDANNLIQFKTSNNSAVMVPSADGRGAVGGSGERFGAVWVEFLRGYQCIVDGENQGITRPAQFKTDGGQGLIVDGDNPTEVRPFGDPDTTGDINLGSATENFSEAHINKLYVADGDNIPQIIPHSDATGVVGKLGSAFDDMRANTFTTNSPEPITEADRQEWGDKIPETAEGKPQMDADELRQSSWYDPPEYVRRQQRERAEKQGHDVADDHGIDLGTMANYVLETCKSQQATIDDQRERIDDLEARLEALEQTVQ